MKKFSIQNLLDWLEVKGLLKNRPFAESYLLCDKNRTHHSVYLKIIMDLIALVAFGVLMTSLFMTYFSENNIKQVDLTTLTIGSLSTNYTLILFGLIFILIGRLSYYFTQQSSELIQNVSLSFGLFCMLTGKVLFLAGFCLLAIPLSPVLKLVLGLLIIVPVSYIYFPLALNRFISTLALLFCIMISLMSNSFVDFHFTANVGFLLYYLCLVLLVSFLFTWKNKPISLNGFAYACVVMLCLNAVSISFLNENNMNAILFDYHHIPTLYFDLILGVVLIAQCLYFSGGWEKIYELPTLFTVMALGALSLIANNAILLAIGLLIVSYGKHERVLNKVASVFLVLFLIEYYTQLPTSMSYKAILLIGSGAMLLFIRWVMKFEHWD